MKILCIGRNYVEHARELKNEIPDSPLVFMKPSTALWKGENWPMPRFSEDVHYECEWVLRMGMTARNLDEAHALDCVDAMTLGIDFTARDLQAKLKKKGHPWELAKAFDGSAMVGNWIPFNGDDQLFSFYRGEQLLQQGNTRLMMFKLPFLIHYLSQYFTLEPGDLIFTGTPKGVGPVKKGASYAGFLGEEKLLSFSIEDA